MLHRAAHDLTALRRVAARILDRNLSDCARLAGTDLDLDMVAERGQKPHQPLKGNLGELPSQDFRQLGLGGSDPPRRRALCQAQRLDRLVEPKDKLCLEIMFFRIRKAKLQPDVPTRVLSSRCFGHHIIGQGGG